MFRDRVDAGERLGATLERFRADSPILLGLARGGVIVAAPAAERLQAKFDVLVVRKVGSPGNREYGIGAVAPSGVSYFDDAAVRATGISPAELERRTREETDEVNRRIEVYRGGDPSPEVARRCVIVVDDGLATGATAIAAIRYVRTLQPSRIVLAIPVISGPALQAVQDEADDTVFLALPDPFYAVGQVYEEFGEVTDDEVRSALRRS